MADNGEVSQDDQSRPRHHSPQPGISDVRREGVKDSSSGQPVESPRAHRRPSRTHSVTQDSARSISPYEDTDKGRVKRSKQDRNMSKKITRSDSVQDYTSSVSQSGELNWEEDADAFIPKLGQILEDRENRPSKNRASSTVSSTVSSSVDPRVRRRRRTEDSDLGHSRVREKHSSSRRRHESLASQPNSSLGLNLSGLTQQPNTSNESNSTITQQYYHGQGYHIEPYEKERLSMPASANSPTVSEMEPAQSNVFQYMTNDPMPEQFVGGVPHGVRPTASSSSSFEASHTQDGSSSNAEENQHSNISPATSPALTRRSNSDVSHRRRRRQHPRDPKVPLYASSFVHGHGSQGGDSENVENEESNEEGSTEEHNANSYPVDTHYAHPAARNAHPRVSSSSSGNSDLHSRRLRQQERELASHILQNPQPQTDVHLGDASSPNPYPSIPYYEPYSPAGAPPPNLYATGQMWSPMPPMPPPLQIAYTPQSPETTYGVPMALQHHMVAPDALVSQGTPVYPPNYLPYTPEPDLTKTTVVGYELLADKLNKSSKSNGHLPRVGHIAPLYRKFGNLNHRVLLHLQDEISELEEELRYLDESIAQTSSRDEAGHIHPASRRGDARNGSELSCKRTELLGRIFQKIGQYNKALSSFSNVINNLEPASTEDIRSYRKWMEKRAPIDHAESRFLERKDDLVKVSRTKPANARDEQPHSAVVWLPLVLVLPLMAFAMVPNLLGRLFVLLLIGATEIMLVTSTPGLMNFMTVQEWTGIASIYFGVMALLAALTH
ncbi:hypothetical protein P153DRAFT_362327 [Dothidotthia symphoricarpi CBS 119687]|uniref:DUF6594 domain-containing protein n=1 Tax=Dothidotthia symphoricarpi CBS 119687 TaxID=1392245 RepID=A0A6A6ARZ4_9PLEO|nr:uncharacterized protein P153DRAFT_362327 [Dothidotthia symphoricarpi CBS 119687]KAF2134570.1 hypothetical protein P153DRAFT_362327 [Dothidotthia symphoricarpi CBS 119687]